MTEPINEIITILPEVLDQEDAQNLSDQLVHKEQQPVHQLPYSQLGFKDNVGGFIDLQNLLSKSEYGGASGKVAKIEFATGQEAALKVPKSASYAKGDLDIEKRALNRLDDLQGRGVVHLLGTVLWGSEFGLVKEWVNGKVLGRDLIAHWGRLENGQQTPLSDEIEAAKLVLSLFDVVDKIHQRKVLLGDSKPEDAIWDGESVTIIDFAQAGLATYHRDNKQWILDNYKGAGFDKHMSLLEIPGFLADFFLRYTSLSGKPLNEESISKIGNQPLRQIAQKLSKKDYQNVQQVKADLERYFLSLGMTEQDLGLPLKIRPEDIA